MTALAHWALVLLGASAGSSAPRWSRRGWVAAAGLWVVVAVPSLVQLALPGLLTLAERDPQQIEHGQVWRLVTSAVTQDGGPVGTTFNLVVLAVTVATAGRRLGPGGLWAAFGVGAVACDLLVLLVWPSVGAGNSMATFTVAVTATTLAVRADPSAVPIGREVVVALIGVLLLVGHDMHGFAVLVGTALGLVGWRTTRPG